MRIHPLTLGILFVPLSASAGPKPSYDGTFCQVTAVSEQAKALSEWSAAALNLQVASINAEEAQKAYRRAAVDATEEDVVDGKMTPMEQAVKTIRAFDRMRSDPKVKETGEKLSAERASFAPIDRYFKTKYKDLYSKIKQSGIGVSDLEFGTDTSTPDQFEKIGLKKDLDYTVDQCRKIRGPLGD